MRKVTNPSHTYRDRLVTVFDCRMRYRRFLPTGPGSMILLSAHEHFITPQKILETVFKFPDNFIKLNRTSRMPKSSRGNRFGPNVPKCSKRVTSGGSREFLEGRTDSGQHDVFRKHENKDGSFT